MIYAQGLRLVLFALSMCIITAVIFVPYPCLAAANLQLVAFAGWVLVASYQIWFTRKKGDEKHD